MKKTVILYGGLGNQLFQYAFYLFLMKNYKEHNFKLENAFYKVREMHTGQTIEKIMQIHKSELMSTGILSYIRIVILFLAMKLGLVVKDSDLLYEHENFTRYLRRRDKHTVAYFGYWQSYRLVNEVRNELLNHLIMDPNVDNELMTMIQSTTSISIHIRRGDYYSDEFKAKYSEICNVEYYLKAIDFFENKFANPCYFVFSDDIEWVKNNMLFLQRHNAHYVSKNFADTNYIELFYMSKCKHNIIANSSFSWWGAYLNTNPHKTVISPKKWVNDNNSIERVVPPEWIRL